jgi:hypothetical protein
MFLGLHFHFPFSMYSVFHSVIFKAGVFTLHFVSWIPRYEAIRILKIAHNFIGSPGYIWTSMTGGVE